VVGRLAEVPVGVGFLVYLFKRAAQWFRARGSRRWASANATVTAPPITTFRNFRQTVEVVYSYRFEGELYTGIHEELFLFGGHSLTDYVSRFGKGDLLVVRVKPGEPEVSIVRGDDQTLASGPVPAR